MRSQNVPRFVRSALAEEWEYLNASPVYSRFEALWIFYVYTVRSWFMVGERYEHESKLYSWFLILDVGFTLPAACMRDLADSPG